jgi:ketosteroid isomerase-like protein
VSQANVEIVRRALDRAEATQYYGDAEFFAPDLVYRPIGEWAESAECRGLDEYRRFLERFREAWADLTIDEISFHDYGDAVSVRVEFSGHARASGVPITAKVFSVNWLRDGLIVRIEDYTDRDDVLKAVGVE